MFYLDVKCAFLNGPLEETVFVIQPPGFEVKGKEHMVYKFHKAIYGLKQAPRAFNKIIYQILIHLCFERCKVEYGMFVLNLSDIDITIKESHIR
jgi:hypothetical protein